MLPPRFTEVILTSTRSPSIFITSPNTGVPLRIRCPSSVRQFSASCIFSVDPVITVCVECTNALMTFFSSCRTSRTLLKLLRGFASGALSNVSVCSSSFFSSFFFSGTGVFSFPGKEGCMLPVTAALPPVISASFCLISSLIRRISSSFSASVPDGSLRLGIPS